MSQDIKDDVVDACNSPDVCLFDIFNKREFLGSKAVLLFFILHVAWLKLSFRLEGMERNVQTLSLMICLLGAAAHFSACSTPYLIVVIHRVIFVKS
jgi:hypothetical protein